MTAAHTPTCSNIRQAFYQPCKKEVVIALHFHLKVHCNTLRNTLRNTLLNILLSVRARNGSVLDVAWACSCTQLTSFPF